MKQTTTTTRFVLLSTILLISTVMYAQGDKSKRPSPPASATGKVAGATITINYSSPAVKGRKVWGELVPYDKIWRAGANEATIFITDKDIKVEGKPLKAGKYSLYAIPGKNQWTIIFNSETGQWGIKHSGETTEDPAKDVLRVNVTPKAAAAHTENLKYEVDKNGFSLIWENMKVPVAIK